MLVRHEMVLLSCVPGSVCVAVDTVKQGVPLSPAFTPLYVLTQMHTPVKPEAQKTCHISTTGLPWGPLKELLTMVSCMSLELRVCIDVSEVACARH